MVLDKGKNGDFIRDIKEIVSEAKSQVYSVVNSTMVKAYWLIGRRIVEEEQQGKERADYGKQIITTVSKELTEDFGRGFSATNIRYFRQFYQEFPYLTIHHLPSDTSKNSTHHLTSDELNNAVDNEVLYLIFNKLSWTHIRQIMRVKSVDARNYYITESVINAWSVETLDRNIATQYYERLLLSHAKEPVVKEMEEQTKGFKLNKNEF